MDRLVNGYVLNWCGQRLTHKFSCADVNFDDEQQFGAPVFTFTSFMRLSTMCGRIYGKYMLFKRVNKGHSHDPDMRIEFIQKNHEGNSSCPVNSA